ncbi:MAG: hypothetical protein IT318_08360 [Anaerolineales bacterium]|nr:hypothetical protein [Anaerolineales bacterium]
MTTGQQGNAKAAAEELEEILLSFFDAQQSRKLRESDLAHLKQRQMEEVMEESRAAKAKIDEKYGKTGR